MFKRNNKTLLNKFKKLLNNSPYQKNNFKEKFKINKKYFKNNL